MIILTFFQGIVDNYRKAVDNPATLGASARAGREDPAPSFILLDTYLQFPHQGTLQLFSFSLTYQLRRHLLYH